MQKQISSNVVYVTGAKCSAIYDFKSGKVYSINEFGTQILNNYLESRATISDKDMEFIKQIKDAL